jgi:hypothetical protein
MADTKLSALTALTASPATGDEIYLRDISESAADESKRITADDFMFGDAGTPTTQDYGDSAAKGTAIEAARIDHKHAMPAAGNDISARVYNDATQSIGDASLTTLVFDQTRYDPSGLHDPLSNPGRLTVPAGQGGTYIITGNVAWASNATGNRIVRIYKEGSDILVENINLGGTAGILYMTVTTQIDLAATDYVELRVEQNSGDTLNVNASSSSDMREAEFMMAKVLG